MVAIFVVKLPNGFNHLDTKSRGVHKGEDKRGECNIIIEERDHVDSFFLQQLKILLAIVRGNVLDKLSFIIYVIRSLPGLSLMLASRKSL